MMAASLLYGCLTGRAGALLPAALDGASSAVSLSLRLMAGYLFFCGLMEIMKELCLPEKLARLLRPMLRTQAQARPCVGRRAVLRRDVCIDHFGRERLQDAHLLGLPQVTGVHGQHQVGGGVLAFCLDEDGYEFPFPSPDGEKVLKQKLSKTDVENNSFRPLTGRRF